MICEKSVAVSLWLQGYENSTTLFTSPMEVAVSLWLQGYENSDMAAHLVALVAVSLWLRGYENLDCQYTPDVTERLELLVLINQRWWYSNDLAPNRISLGEALLHQSYD